VHFTSVFQSLTNLEAELRRLENKPGRSVAKEIPTGERADVNNPSTQVYTVIHTVCQSRFKSKIFYWLTN